MTIRSTIAVGLHAFDQEISDMQNAVLELLGAFVSSILSIAAGGTNSGTALSGSSIMISNGTQIVQGAAGTATTLLHGNAAGAPTYSAASLTADVTGTLPIGNGGTNSTATATNGGVGYGTGSAHAYSAVGTAGQMLLSAGAASPAWYTTPAAMAYSTAGATLNNNSTTTVVFGTEEVDTDAAYDNATGIFTVPTGKGGHYVASGCIAFGAGFTAALVFLRLSVSGTVLRAAVTVNPGTAETISFAAPVVVVAGDTLKCEAFQNSGIGQAYHTSRELMFFSLKQVA